MIIMFANLDHDEFLEGFIRYDLVGSYQVSKQVSGIVVVVHKRLDKGIHIGVQ